MNVNEKISSERDRKKRRNKMNKITTFPCHRSWIKKDPVKILKVKLKIEYKELKTLIQKRRIYSQDIGMEFGIGKCIMLIMKKGKRETEGEIKLPNQENIGMLGENQNDKGLEILEADTIKQTMKEKI